MKHGTFFVVKLDGREITSVWVEGKITSREIKAPEIVEEDVSSEKNSEVKGKTE